MATKTDELVVLLRADIKGLQASLQSASQNLQNFRKGVDSETTAVRASLLRLVPAAAALAVAFAGIKIGRSLVDAGIQMQALEARMQAATGSSIYAAASMEFVRETASRLGLDIQSTANGFASFTASALRAGLTFQETKDIFNGVSEAATAMRLSGERVQLVFMALSQMASKGRVSMEELRQQLGESLPGALQLFAKGMGVTNSEFIKMVENGKVTVADLKKLGSALHQEFGVAAQQAAGGAQAAFNRFGNAFFELQAKLASSGFLDAIVGSVNRLTNALNDPGLVAGLSAFVSFLSTVIELAARAAAMVGNFLLKLGELQVRAAALVGIGPGVKESPAGGARKPLSIPVNPSYSLGALDVPNGETDEQKRKREAAERKRQQLRNQVEGLRQRNFGDTNRLKQEELEYEKQQELLQKALDAKAITMEEYRIAQEEAEVAHQERLTGIRRSATDAELSMRERLFNSLSSLMNVFAGRNKAIAIAMLAFDKARAIAQATIETHVAAAAALKYDPTGATSARVTMLGYANVAAIAATGIAQLATMGAGGSSSGGGGYSDSGGVSSSGGGYSSGSGRIVHVTLYGDDNKSYTKEQIRNLMEQFNDAGRDGSRFEVALA